MKNLKWMMFSVVMVLLVGGFLIHHLSLRKNPSVEGTLCSLNQEIQTNSYEIYSAFLDKCDSLGYEFAGRKQGLLIIKSLRYPCNSETCCYKFLRSDEFYCKSEEGELKLFSLEK